MDRIYPHGLPGKKSVPGGRHSRSKTSRIFWIYSPAAHFDYERMLPLSCCGLIANLAFFFKPKAVTGKSPLHEARALKNIPFCPISSSD